MLFCIFMYIYTYVHPFVVAIVFDGIGRCSYLSNAYTYCFSDESWIMTHLVMCACDRLVIYFINLRCNKHSCRLHWFYTPLDLFYFSGFTFQTCNMDNFSTFQIKNVVFLCRFSHLRAIYEKKCSLSEIRWSSACSCFSIESVWFHLIYMHI